MTSLHWIRPRFLQPLPTWDSDRSAAVQTEQTNKSEAQSDIAILLM